MPIFGAMRRPKRQTTPPAVVPLLPVCLLALIVGDHAVALARVLLGAVGIGELDDRAVGELAAAAAAELVLLALFSLALRWIVRRWVIRSPPP